MLTSLFPRARRAGLAVLVAVAAGGALAAPASAAGEESGAYIVVLKDSVRSASAVADEHRRHHAARVSHAYEHALKGYAAELTRRAYADVLADRRVAYVEPDGVVQASVTQSNATWGLDRIDQRALPLDVAYTYTNTGSGVTAYVIDTGIRITHNEFGGRAVHGSDIVDGDNDSTDCNGHGTHVAGTIGGETYGVAKAVTLVGVRVLNCSGSGTWSGVIAGINWVTDHHVAGTPAVANLSLGGGANSSVDEAVQGMINDGVATAVAAGNGNSGGREQDACNYSPARVAEAMTISATNDTDAKASWANYGSCVDWFAPGVSITSAWYTSDTANNTISGTSMAAPHTAGVAALYLEGQPLSLPQQVRDALYDFTTKEVVTSSKTANNHLVFSFEELHAATDSGSGGDGGTTKPGNGKGSTK